MSMRAADRRALEAMAGTDQRDDAPPPHDAECECPVCVINDALGYDADASDPRQYCRHGTFIGSWWGPDILCGRCEMGED